MAENPPEGLNLFREQFMDNHYRQEMGASCPFCLGTFADRLIFRAHFSANTDDQDCYYDFLEAFETQTGQTVIWEEPARKLEIERKKMIQEAERESVASTETALRASKDIGRNIGIQILSEMPADDMRAYPYYKTLVLSRRDRE